MKLVSTEDRGVVGAEGGERVRGRATKKSTLGSMEKSVVRDTIVKMATEDKVPLTAVTIYERHGLDGLTPDIVKALETEVSKSQ